MLLPLFVIPPTLAAGIQSFHEEAAFLPLHHYMGDPDWLMTLGPVAELGSWKQHDSRSAVLWLPRILAYLPPPRNHTNPAGPCLSCSFYCTRRQTVNTGVSLAASRDAKLAGINCISSSWCLKLAFPLINTSSQTSQMFAPSAQMTWLLLSGCLNPDLEFTLAFVSHPADPCPWFSVRLQLHPEVCYHHLLLSCFLPFLVCLFRFHTSKSLPLVFCFLLLFSSCKPWCHVSPRSCSFTSKLNITPRPAFLLFYC